MSNLNKNAEELARKYISQSSSTTDTANRPKRGLQAEINKVEAIRRVIGTKDFDPMELSRFKTVINNLTQTIDFKIQNS